jgi:hypothetical protein
MPQALENGEGIRIARAAAHMEPISCLVKIPNILRCDGKTAMLLLQVHVDEQCVPSAISLAIFGHTSYAGALDSLNNLWFARISGSFTSKQGVFS